MTAQTLLVSKSTGLDGQGRHEAVRHQVPVDVAMTSTVQPGASHPQGVTVRDQDKVGWSSREDALEEGPQAIVDVLDRLAPAPSHLGDVQPLGSRLGHQLLREAALEDAQALLAQGDVLFDAHPEHLPDHRGCLRGPDQVTADQTHILARAGAPRTQ